MTINTLPQGQFAQTICKDKFRGIKVAYFTTAFLGSPPVTSDATTAHDVKRATMQTHVRDVNVLSVQHLYPQFFIVTGEYLHCSIFDEQKLVVMPVEFHEFLLAVPIRGGARLCHHQRDVMWSADTVKISEI